MTTDANANMSSQTNEGAEMAKTMKALSAPSVMYSTEIEDSVNDYISKLTSEGEAEEAKAALEKPDPTAEDSEEVVDEVEVKADEPEKVVEEDEGLKRIMAREEAVRKMETEFEAKVASAVKAKVPDFRGKSPEEILKMTGWDPELALKEMMFARASDTNPVKAKLKEELRDYHTKKEIESMRLELERRDAQASQAQYFQTVSTEARQYVEKVDEKVSPVFSKLAKAEANYAHQRVMQEIVKDAQERLARGENGDPLQYSEAVARVEKDLAILAKVLEAKNAVDDKNSKKSAVSSPAMKTNKPLVKQHKEPTSDELIQQAIDKATKTYFLEEEKLKSGKR